MADLDYYCALDDHKCIKGGVIGYNSSCMGGSYNSEKKHHPSVCVEPALMYIHTMGEAEPCKYRRCDPADAGTYS